MQTMSALLHGDCLTVSGETIAQNLQDYRYKFPHNPEVISTIDAPFGHATRGWPSCAATWRRPPQSPSRRRSIRRCTCSAAVARVFDSEEAAEAAILGGGDPRRRRHRDPLRRPQGRPRNARDVQGDEVPLRHGAGQEDGADHRRTLPREPTTAVSSAISRPEAADGGPLAAVADGDKITIDIPQGILHLHLDDHEIAARLENWQRPKPKFNRGYLGVYSRLASSAAEGAVIKCS